MKYRRALRRAALSAFAILASVANAHADSTGIIVESVNNFGGSGDLSNSIANGDGFLQGVVFPGSRFFQSARWTDGLVYDTDFVDPQINALGNDSNNFDKPGTAISFLTAHGVGTHGCSTQRCTSTSQCQSPGTGGGRFPASCRFSPMDPARCCYMVDRQAVVHGNQDKFNGLVNYTNGPVRWGESPQSGGWAGAGTNGGTNVVVLDISHGILPTFWRPTLLNASAGVQMVLTIMTAGGDTANVSQRGSTFAAFFRANPNASVAQSWLNTMPSLPANLGGSCPAGGGGHGFNGCGCNIAVGMDKTQANAEVSMRENWVNITNDNNDAVGNVWTATRWQCNYPFSQTDQTAWELP